MILLLVSLLSFVFNTFFTYFVLFSRRSPPPFPFLGGAAPRMPPPCVSGVSGVRWPGGASLGGRRVIYNDQDGDGPWNSGLHASPGAVPARIMESRGWKLFTASIFNSRDLRLLASLPRVCLFPATRQSQLSCRGRRSPEAVEGKLSQDISFSPSNVNQILFFFLPLK